MLPGMTAIYKRELRLYLRSASTYIVLGLLFLTAGAAYHDMMVGFVNTSAEAFANIAAPQPPNINGAVIKEIFNLMVGVIMFVIPMLSMRLIASERSGGTFEVLVTSPLSDWAIVLGKYFALVTLGGIITLLAVIYPFTTWLLGREQGALPEWPVVFTSHVGIFLIFATYSAFGLMASSFTSSQVTAAILTLIGLLFWNLIGDFPIGIPAVETLFHELSASRHTENFVSGFLTLRDVVFFGFSSFFCLFVAAQTLDARRWRE